MFRQKEVYQRQVRGHGSIQVLRALVRRAVQREIQMIMATSDPQCRGPRSPKMEVQECANSKLGSLLCW